MDRDAALDAYIHAVETARTELEMLDAGLLDPGQPTEAAHLRHVAAMEAEFTPRERRAIRYALGIGEETGG